MFCDHEGKVLKLLRCLVFLVEMKRVAMATFDDNWQTKRPTISGRIKFIFNNELLSDVKFVAPASNSESETGAPNDNFRENICSEDDLRTRIFGTFVVKFLACLPLLGFSNIYKMV